MNNFSDKANFLWGVADLIRDTFKRGKYQDVILPFTVLRRIDCVLQPTKAAVLERFAALDGRLQNLAPQLQRASGYAFYNTSRYDFERLLKDAPNLGANLREYIAGFSENMRQVLGKFDFENTITKLEEANLLFLVMERFGQIDLHPDAVSNLEMGYIFEELIRKFNEALNENPGEHFTPREVIRLMVNLSLAEDLDALRHPAAIRTIYDPCCGSGGMLTTAKDRIGELNASADVHLFGQEVNPETFAICKSDLYMKSADGRDAENIYFGSTLAADALAGRHFDYILANPPYGKDWKMDQKAVEDEHRRGEHGRFPAGLPRISDGQLLFLQHMLTKMKPLGDDGKGGSRVAIVMNGSPLFTGDAGSGESEIRRWILENDWLEAIVALPEQLFYNTGIATYIWVLSNRKSAERRGRVQLIDATSQWAPMRKSLGDKRREITDAQIEEITRLFLEPAPSPALPRLMPGEGDVVRWFATTDFGYRKITVERPLRLNFAATPERIARLREQKAFADLAASKKKNEQERAAEEQGGRTLQDALIAALATLPATLYTDRVAFAQDVERATRKVGLHPPVAVMKAILTALSERDETAEVCRDKDGNPEPDPDLRDTENVPLGEDVADFFRREVLPHVPDAWINTGLRDPKDGGVGRVGYEINFNRYFYRYTPPRPLEEIDAEIKALEAEILTMLREVAG